MMTNDEKKVSNEEETKRSNSAKLIIRLFIYILGLFLIALGVAFSINSQLGITPASSLPYVISLIAKWPLKLSVTAIYTVLVCLQWFVLKKDFKWTNLFQIAFALIYGIFCDWTVKMLGSFGFESYIGRVFMSAISALLVGLGVFLYVEARIMPMPVEGLAVALSLKKPKFRFSTYKIIVDATIVSLSIILSLIVTGRLEGVREGTVFLAFAVGLIVKLFQKILSPFLKKVLL